MRLVERREPFADATPVPLDLVTPVRSFTPAGAGASLGARRVAGRAATGVAATAAQVAPLLAGLAPAGAGNLRSLHPADRVELWLDEAAPGAAGPAGDRRPHRRTPRLGGVARLPRPTGAGRAGAGALRGCR